MRFFFVPFQFTQPKRAATLVSLPLLSRFRVSIHAAQAGCDDLEVHPTRQPWSFNSRSPSGLRLYQHLHFQADNCVSIHAAQAGCDWPSEPVNPKTRLFQFTQPKRAATLQVLTTKFFFYVSIHAAQAGCDKPIVVTSGFRCVFQFTQPKRAATSRGGDEFGEMGVSIHAAQAGCDFCVAHLIGLRIVSIHAAQAGCDWVFLLPFSQLHCGFNSRSPSGLRPHAIAISNAKFVFQFTQPKRAATIWTRGQ